MSPGKGSVPSPDSSVQGSPTPRGCTCFRLRRLTRRVTAVYNQALAPTGMRVTQYSLLSHLRGAGAVPLSQLAETLDMDRTTLTRNLRPLTDAGWAKIESSSLDARVRLVTLTARGEEHLRTARGYWRRAQDEINSTIGPVDLAHLHTLLDRYVPLFRPAAGNEGDVE